MSGAVTASTANEKAPGVLPGSNELGQREHKVAISDTIKSADEQESCRFWSCLSSFFCCICSFFSWIFSEKEEAPAAQKKPEPDPASVIAIVEKAPTDPRVAAFVEYWYPDNLTQEEMAQPINYEKFIRDFHALPKGAVLEGRKAIWDAHFIELSTGMKPKTPDKAVPKAIDAYIKAHPFDPVLMQRLRSL